ncbi:MAG TPA: gamma-glutamyl-gamma-aminobutyrate hydrolase family protein [Thermoanaerobaculia bacterium]|nr:gamma-glutamyl-gamma-aminobutyrate hydrolase family protein [Thermoanaerobaculia bacterium]
MSGRILVAHFRDDKLGPYRAALVAAGASGEEIEPVSPRSPGAARPAALVAAAGGLLLTGGPDLQPALYREARIPEASVSDPQPGRDQLEWDLLAAAAALHRPVFGICRGAQLLNVFLGGSLWQDIPLQLPRAGRHGHPVEEGWAPAHPAHGLVPAPDDAHELTRLLASPSLAVNSRHHQALRELGAGLRISATAPDGVIEAVYLDSAYWWVRAVQWHPEDLVADPVHRELFRQFLAAAGSAGPGARR